MTLDFSNPAHYVLALLPETDAALPVILVRAGEHSTALATDELVGSREIVVKPVGPQIAGIRGIYHDHLTRRETLYGNERRVRDTAFWRVLRASASQHGGVGVPGVFGHALGVEVVEHARAPVVAHPRA